MQGGIAFHCIWLSFVSLFSYAFRLGFNSYVNGLILKILIFLKLFQFLVVSIEDKTLLMLCSISVIRGFRCFYAFDIVITFRLCFQAWHMLIRCCRKFDLHSISLSKRNVFYIPSKIGLYINSDYVFGNYPETLRGFTENIVSLVDLDLQSKLLYA